MKRALKRGITRMEGANLDDFLLFKDFLVKRIFRKSWLTNSASVGNNQTSSSKFKSLIARLDVFKIKSIGGSRGLVNDKLFTSMALNWVKSKFLRMKYIVDGSVTSLSTHL